MSVLESSVRKLVREEATGAAIETLEAAIKSAPEILRPEELKIDILKTVQNVSREQLAAMASRSVALTRELEIKRKSNPVETPAGDLLYEQLATMRHHAIALAVQIELDPDKIFATAEKIARFIINGELNGIARDHSTEDAA